MPTLEQILSDAGLSGDEKAKLEDAFNLSPTIKKHIEGGFLRQSDYSREMDKIRQKERETEAYKAKLEENWNKANEEYLRMQTEAGTTVAELEAAKNKLREVEDKLATVPQIDPSKFIAKEDMENQFRTFAAGQTAYFGDVLEIMDEHRELTGNKLNPKTLIREAMEAKKTPMEYWNEKYQVENLRSEKAKAADEARIAEIKEEARKEAMAMYANPASRPLRDSDKPFYERLGSDGKNPWDDNGPSDAEKNLVAALQEVGR